MENKKHKCISCKEEKDNFLFYKRSENNKWLRSNCKDCTRKNNKKWIKNNRERYLLLLKNWNINDKFGISINDYFNMLDKQNGLCAICKNKETKTNNRTVAINKKTRFSIDHDHKTGKVRGLLCHSCNVAIGFFKEDIGSLKRAILYLQEKK